MFDDDDSDVVDGNRLTRRLINDSDNDRDQYDKFDNINEETNKLYWSRQTKIPWKAITLAALLMIGGTGLLVLSALIWVGVIPATEESGEVFVPLGLGLLMFIPGFYHVRIAYYAFRQSDGFTFDDIPDFS